MAKKNTKKTEVVEVSADVNTSTEAIEVTGTTGFLETNVEVAGAMMGVSSIPKIHNLSPLELRAYEELIYKLVIYYEKMLRLDEVEGRPVMSENRNKYTRLSVLHKDIMKVIEDKVIELEGYDWN